MAKSRSAGTVPSSTVPSSGVPSSGVPSSTIPSSRPPARTIFESVAPAGAEAGAERGDGEGGASEGGVGGVMSVGTPCSAHQPEVRLHFDGARYLSPEEVHDSLLRPAGVSGVLAVIAVGPNESRVPCRSWSEAYRLLSYCTTDVQRHLGLRCRPACVEGVQLTRTQMARLAQSEGPAHPHVLRADSARASLTTPPQHLVHATPAHRPSSTGSSSRSPRAAGVPAL